MGIRKVGLVNLSAEETYVESVVRVDARPLWNEVCTLIEGKSYSNKATGYWWDWFVRSGPEGYSGILLKPFSHGKRSPDDNWFCLTGAIDEDPKTVFRIGSSKTWTAPRAGRLTCFANDIPAMCWNNWGEVRVEIGTT